MKSKIIEDLVRLSKEAEVPVTRNMYRANGAYSEADIGKIFGTFQELRRQAGLLPSREQQKLANNLAKHNSLDKRRIFTGEKRKWAESYEKPDGKRFKTYMTCSDLHDIECDAFWRHVFVDSAKRIQPSIITINGDALDLPEFSKYTVDPRSWDVIGRIKWFHQFLQDLREACPDTQIDFIEGNHEHRLLKWLCEAAPALQTILSDLHGWTIPDLLGLTKYEVNYIAPADLSPNTKYEINSELGRNFKVYDDFLVKCHFPEAKRWNLPGLNGHHHKHVCQTFYSPVRGTFEWHQTGGGHVRQASYCNGEQWSTGFSIEHIDTEKQLVQFEYIDTTQQFCMVGGKFYS